VSSAMTGKGGMPYRTARSNAANEQAKKACSKKGT
jgi:hypothetical protein